MTGTELDRAALLEEALGYVRLAKSPNTRRAYRADWEDFVSWCSVHQLCPCPATPETAALYITDAARTKKPSTLSRRLASITQYHRAAGAETPAESAAVRIVMAGIRRKKGMARNRKRPLSPSDLAAALASCPDTLLGLRNRALLLTGFAAALRRSELVSLRWEDLETVDGEGVTIRITRSKTDPEGQGRVVGVPFSENPATCPVRALEDWNRASGQTAGPVFRVIGRTGKVMDEALSDRAVARLVKQVVQALGHDPRQFSGHSLRSGLATAAAAGGASERSIMEQTGHRDLRTLRMYIREGSLFRDNAWRKTGL